MLRGSSNIVGHSENGPRPRFGPRAKHSCREIPFPPLEARRACSGARACMMVQESHVPKRARLDHDPRVQEYRFGRKAGTEADQRGDRSERVWKIEFYRRFCLSACDRGGAAHGLRNGSRRCGEGATLRLEKSRWRCTSTSCFKAEQMGTS